MSTRPKLAPWAIAFLFVSCTPSTDDASGTAASGAENSALAEAAAQQPEDDVTRRHEPLDDWSKAIDAAEARAKESHPALLAELRFTAIKWCDVAQPSVPLELNELMGTIRIRFLSGGVQLENAPARHGCFHDMAAHCLYLDLDFIESARSKRGKTGGFASALALGLAFSTSINSELPGMLPSEASETGDQPAARAALVGTLISQFLLPGVPGDRVTPDLVFDAAHAVSEAEASLVRSHLGDIVYRVTPTKLSDEWVAALIQGLRDPASTFAAPR